MSQGVCEENIRISFTQGGSAHCFCTSAPVAGSSCSENPLQLGEAVTEVVFATILCKAEICSASRPQKTDERKRLPQRLLRA
jgi:hypothetical protein